MREIMEKLSGDVLEIGADGVKPPLSIIANQSRLAAEVELMQKYSDEAENIQERERNKLLASWASRVMEKHDVPKEMLPGYVRDALEEVEDT
jgi:hypothetical protein